MFSKVPGLLIVSVAVSSVLLFVLNLHSVQAQGDLSQLQCLPYFAICSTELKIPLRNETKPAKYTKEYCCDANALKIEECFKKKMADDPKCKDVKFTKDADCDQFKCDGKNGVSAISTFSVGLTLVVALFARFLF